MTYILQVRAADILKIPVIATEQYPKGETISVFACYAHTCE